MEVNLEGDTRVVIHTMDANKNIGGNIVWNDTDIVVRLLTNARVLKQSLISFGVGHDVNNICTFLDIARLC